MGDDFDGAAGAGAPSGPGGSATARSVPTMPGIIATTKSGRYDDLDDEALQSIMQKGLRRAQEHRRNLEQKQKAWEREQAQLWCAHLKEEQAKKKQEREERLALLQLQKQRAKQRRSEPAEPVTKQVSNGSTLDPSAWAQSSPRAVAAQTLKAGVEAATFSDASHGSSPRGTAPSTPKKAPAKPAAVKVTRKKRQDEDVLLPEHSSVVQDLHNKLRQKLGFHTLVNQLQQAKDLKSLGRLQSPRGAKGLDAQKIRDSEAAEHAEDDDEHTLSAAKQRHLARRHRLRMMRQVATQVLQCRRYMEGAFAEETVFSKQPQSDRVEIVSSKQPQVDRVDPILPADGVAQSLNGEFHRHHRPALRRPSAPPGASDAKQPPAPLRVVKGWV